MLSTPSTRRRRFRSVAAISGLTAAALALTGCSSAKPQASSKALSVGIVTFSTSDVDTNKMVTSMTKVAKSKGWSVENLNANGDQQQAVTDIKNLVTKNVSAIIVTVFDSTALASGLSAARAANIPVLSAGGGMAQGIALSTDDGAGKPMVDLMLKDIKNTGTVLNLTYHPGVPCRQRADAFDSIVKKQSGVSVTNHEISIPGAAETSKAATSAWLSANANKSGNFAIFNCYDDNALGAVSALQQNGRTDVKVYSYNATPSALQAVRAGTMTATLWLDLASAGKILVDSIPQIRSQGASWKPRSVIPDYVIVTKSNIDSFSAAHAG
jgi:ABC-type sugar transport system substrate-binding protein